jgi:hypothetical protein
MPIDDHERAAERTRAQAWYAILGLAALTAGVFVILRWLPDNPFHVPSELPNTTQFNSDALTGRAAPMLNVTPSERAALGPSCRVSDVALVREWRSPVRVTVSEALMRYLERRGRAAEPGGWHGESPDDDAGAVACIVRFRLRDRGHAVSADFGVDPDRQRVTARNDLARHLMGLGPPPRTR